MADLIITPSLGKIDFIHQSAQAPRFESIILHEEDGLVFTGKISASSVTAPLNVINVTAGSSNANYPFIFASSGETGAKSLLMDSVGGTYNPSTNTATIDISGNSATTTLASNSTNLGGVGAASYVTLTDTQTLTNKTITGTFTGNLSGTSSWATNATNALTATNATQLNGQAASYYTNITARLGYTPVDRAGDTVSGNLTVNGNFSVNGSFTAFSASNIYLSSSVLTIEDNILTLNAFSPYLRYAGIEMYDSGSGTLSSLLWDGEGDYFFLTGSTVNGKIITGPDAQANLTANFVPKATAGNKLGNSLIFDNGTGVGINKTSFRLNCALDVNGSACFGTSAYGFYVGTDATGTFLDAGTQLMRVFTGQQERLRIDTSGNVGIGTTVPVARLQVNSTTSGDTLFRTDGTNGTLFSVVDDLSDSLMSVNNSAGLPVLEVFADDRIVAGQYGQNDLVVINNKVGLGTNNPANKLYVSGSVSIGSGTYNISAPTNGLIVEGKVGVGTNSVDSWAQLKVIGTSALGGIVYVTDKIQALSAFPGSATNLQLNTDGGNVGIGTTLPFAKLHVQGNISASSFTSSISNAVGFLGTSSWANNASSTISSSYALNATSASYALLASTVTTASYANNLNAANQYTVGGITGSLFGTSSWATNALTANNVNNATLTVATGSGISLSATPTFTANASVDKTITITNTGVTAITTNTGLSTNASATGAVTITNTGVTSNVAGSGISVSGATGAVTITNSSPNATHTGDVTGATALTIANDAVTTVKILDANVTNAKLTNSSITIGSTAISLGGTTTLLPGLTSITSTTVNATTVNATNISASATGSFGIVGIGTNSPAYKLDINGITRFQNIIRLKNDGWNLTDEGQVRFYFDTSGRTYFGSGNGYEWRSVADAALMVLTNAGNVGIGTTSAITKLDVRNGYITSGTNTSTAGTVIIGGYYGDGNLTILGTEYASGGPVLGYGVTPSTSAAGAFFSSTGVNVYRSAYVQDGGSHRWYTGGAQTVTTGNSVTISEKMRMDTNGNIGIGTTSPTAKVESYYSSNAITFNYLATNLNGNSPIPVYGFDVTSGAEARSIKAGIGYERHLTNGRGTMHFYNDSTNDTASLTGSRSNAIDIKMSLDNSGNLGIGTTTPATKLDVSGSISIRGTAVLQSASDIFPAGLGYDIYGNIRVLRSTSAQADGMYIGYGGAGGNLRFFSNSGTTEFMTVATTGNVGIGSTNPACKLDVAGTIRSSTSEIYGFGASDNVSIRAASSVNVMGLYTSGFEKVRIDANGNVGVGNTGPGQKLDVEGRIRTRGATGTGGFEIGAATTGTAKWRIEWDSASDSLDFNWVG